VRRRTTASSCATFPKRPRSACPRKGRRRLFARDLSKDDIAHRCEQPQLPRSKAATRVRSSISGLNQKNSNLAKREVREALKWLTDYDAIERNLTGRPLQDAPGLPADRLPGCDRRQALQVRSCQGQGAAGGRGPARTASAVTMDVRNVSPIPGHRAGDPGAMGRRPASSSNCCPATARPDADQVPRAQPRHRYRPVGPGLPGPAHERGNLRHQRTTPTMRAPRRSRGATPGHPGDEPDDPGRRAGDGPGRSARRPTRTVQREHQKTVAPS